MAPLPTSAQEDAFDFIQARRSEAGKLWQRKDRAGIDLLLKTLPYLDQPLVRDLSLGSPTLAGRRLNIHLDLAAAYARQEQATESLDYIRKVLAEKRLPDLAITSSMTKRSTRFAGIRNSGG